MCVCVCVCVCVCFASCEVPSFGGLAVRGGDCLSGGGVLRHLCGVCMYLYFFLFAMVTRFHSTHSERETSV